MEKGKINNKKIKKYTICAFQLFFMIFSLSNFSYGQKKGNVGDNKDEAINNFLNKSVSYSSPSDINRINYFKNLYKYSPFNSLNSCGYVSFSQYFSYYDTFLNNNLIPKKFERNNGVTLSFDDAISSSPGVFRNEYTGDLKDKNEIYNFVLNSKEYDYQSYLMYEYYNNMGFSSIDTSINMRQYEDLIKSVFPNFSLNFNYSDVKVGSHWNSSSILKMYNFATRELDKGNPVFLHIAFKDLNENGNYDGYHSVVAYYYDDKGIHCNFGWGENSTDIVIDNNEYFITDVGYYDMINVPHVHSFHYNINDEGYCGCGYHKHIHNYEYKWMTYEKHLTSCSCGKKSEEGHVVSSDAFNNGNVYADCLICGGRASIGFTMNATNYLESYVLENGNIIISNHDLNLVLNNELTWEELYEKIYR